MTLVIGTDEAGYGPNLGPLVVAATAWRVDPAAADVEAALADAVGEARRADGRPLWADSKQVLRGSGGFAALEAGVLAGVAVSGGGVPGGWPALAAAVAAGPPPPAAEDEALARLVLPLAARSADVAALAATVRERMEARGVRLVAIRVRVVRPAEFNALLDRGLNKSDLLSQVTLDLAATLASRDPGVPEPPSMRPPAGPLLVWCDRHGGRRRYAPLVARHFGATLVHTVEETAARSAYELPDACRVEFCVGGEARGPVALASMTAKYVRELAMQAFNACWCARCAGLVPTAGYPVDAVRWRRDATTAVERAGVAWDELWRRA